MEEKTRENFSKWSMRGTTEREKGVTWKQKVGREDERCSEVAHQRRRGFLKRQRDVSRVTKSNSAERMSIEHFWEVLPCAAE